MKKLLSQYIGHGSFLRRGYHLLWALFGNIMYGFPGYQKAKILCITGTNGKSTTTTMAAHILQSQGYRVAYATTVMFQIGEQTWKNTTHKTTLGRFGVYTFLHHCKKAKVDYIVLEVSSHAIDQFRIFAVPYRSVACTNLAPEHLDYHKTMDNYVQAKAKLFTGKHITRAVIPYKFSYKNIFENKRKTSRNTNQALVEFSQNDNSADFSLHNINTDPVTQTQKANLLVSGAHVGEFTTKLLWSFNLENIITAFALCYPDIQNMNKALDSIASFAPIPGRIEPVQLDSKPDKLPKAIIDFAVTPDAFALLFNELQKLCKGELWAVFGATGDRDKQKRPFLTAQALNSCDHVILTTDEPYTENLHDILDDLEKGRDPDFLQTNGYQEKAKECLRIADRRQAIEYAVNNAKQNDLIVVTGMGDLDSAVFGTKKYPWSDREEIKKAMQNRLDSANL